MADVSVDLVRRLEHLAARAWPARHVEDLDGWRLRHTDGVTRRANSVLANECAHRLPLADRLARVEEVYAGWGLPARYQLCPSSQPADLDAALAARGYRSVAPTCVQAAGLDAVLAGTASAPADRVSVAEELNDRWLATYCRADGFGGTEAAVRAGILRRLHPPVGFALLELDGRPAAVGLGVAEEDWMGVFCMGTCPGLRRRGAATAVLHALARWGRRQGAARAYLQVMEDNAPALALYARAGFASLYSYHYRESPGPAQS